MTVDPRGRPTTRMPPLSPDVAADAALSGLGGVGGAAGVGAGVADGGGVVLRRPGDAAGRAGALLSAARSGVRAAVVSRSEAVSEGARTESGAGRPVANPWER